MLQGHKGGLGKNQYIILKREIGNGIDFKGFSLMEDAMAKVIKNVDMV